MVGRAFEKADDPNWCDPERIRGRTILGFRRILLVFEGNVLSSDGPIEFTFSDGSAVCLDAGGDGEVLAMKPATWVDPFNGELTLDPEEWLRVHGRWTAFDVSREEQYRHLLGQPASVTEVERLDDGKPVGVEICVGDFAIEARTFGADDLFVSVTNVA